MASINHPSPYMNNPLRAAAFALLLLPCTVAFAQGSTQSWEEQVRQFDSGYWKAFNACEVKKLAAMKTDDLEFYHDVGGVSKGGAVVVESIAKNICGRPDFRIRREAVEGSVRFYPMRDGGKLYGAIVSGEHLFHETPKGGKEVLTGRARFTHMLLLRDGQWKMSRVLSFDHGPAGKQTDRAEAHVPAAQLDKLAGHYVEKDGAFMNIKRDGKRLSLDSGKTVFVLKAAGKDEFFASDRPLTMMFTRDRAGKGHKLTVREEGKVVAVAVRR